MQRALVALSLLVLPAAPLFGQSLADRIAGIRDGYVRFQFNARPGICGDGEHFIRMGRHTYMGNMSAGPRDLSCVPGPVQIRMRMDEGTVERLEYWVGPVREREGQQLGVVSSAEAARFLLGIAARGSSSPSAKAIFPAVIADSAMVWPTLLTIAHDEATRSRNARQEAMMWLSRFAAGALAGRPNDPTVDDDHDDDGSKEDLKSHAVFVLSQLRNHEGVPALLDVARSSRDVHVRGQALYWLGQSGDPRALALFESILRG